MDMQRSSSPPFLEAAHTASEDPKNAVPCTPTSVKVLLVGRAWAGKTALVDRLARRTFNPNVRLTLGVENTAYRFRAHTGEVVEAYIWDVQGHENAGLLRPVYYRGAHAAIVVVDLDVLNYSKSVAAAADWKRDIDVRVQQAHDASPVPIMLVGNKCDLDTRVGDDALHDFVTKNGFLGYMETSAKEGTNVTEMFHRVFQEALAVRRHEIHYLEQRSNEHPRNLTNNHNHSSLSNGNGVVSGSLPLPRTNTLESRLYTQRTVFSTAVDGTGRDRETSQGGAPYDEDMGDAHTTVGRCCHTS